ncbi:YbhB/YbcL family Raf kinase inhibitor-like protein [Streptomyces sp. NPDC046821]|uniref:YbhB/YbcL family Raf kinase inhibitor-like protein n=1 Tax=Streptomyces sp. NPDC046821 TaxID=3154702 RepID=UPI0033F0C310
MPHAFDPYSALPSVPEFVLHSTDIADGKPLDVAQCSSLFGGPGEDRSPHLSWEGFPGGTQSFAVTCFDPDAPTASGFWHWAVYDIPASVHELASGAGAAGGKYLPEGAKMLANDAGGNSFLGAVSPAGHGPHRYMYVVHALNTAELDVPPAASPAWLGYQLYDHSVGRATLTPIFEIPV